MTTSGRQDDNMDKQAIPGPGPQGEPVNIARRRIGKSGLAISGVLATLASRPVFGVVSKSPSGFLSGNLSTHGTPSVSAGRSPGYWKTHTHWPIPNRDTVLFSSVFTCTVGSTYASMTMLALLESKDDKHNLAMHLIAAYLNAMKGWTPFLTVSRIQSMWTELQMNGYFSPTAGVQWSAEQVVDYIQQTFAY